jgi:hypothetical protein
MGDAINGYQFPGFPGPNAADLQQGTNYMHNKEIGLRRWRAARAKALAGQSKFNVAFIADSIGEGTGASNHYTKGLAGLLRSYFTSAPFNDTGVGFIPAHYSTSSGTQWMALGGTGWVDDNTYGVCKRAKRSSTIGDTVTFTFTGTSCDIWYVQRSGGGQFSVAVDGGGATTTNTSGSTAFAKKNISGLSAGSHTVVLTVTTAGMVTIVGYNPYVGATYGIQFNTLAKFGSVVSDHTASTAIQMEVDLQNPRLTIIALMANDSNSQTSLGFYKDNIKILIDRAKSFNSDVLLVSTGLRDGVFPIPQSAYNDVLKELAYAYDCAYLDVFSAWGGDNGYAWHVANLDLIQDVPGDKVHPVDGGHYDICQRIIKMLE